MGAALWHDQQPPLGLRSHGAATLKRSSSKLRCRKDTQDRKGPGGKRANETIFMTFDAEET